MPAGIMDLIDQLAWMLNLIAAYGLVVGVFLVFREDLLGHRSRGMIITAMLLAVTYLTTRIIRTQMTDMPTGRGIADMPLTQAIAIATVFMILAAMGSLRLIAVATALIATDVAWILDTPEALVELSC